MPEHEVGLMDAIGSLREDLLKASAEGHGSPMRFRIGAVELSLQVALTKETNGRVGWTVLGVGGKRSDESRQTLTIQLEPLWQGEEDGGASPDFTIADAHGGSAGLGGSAAS